MVQRKVLVRTRSDRMRIPKVDGHVEMTAAVQTERGNLVVRGRVRARIVFRQKTLFELQHVIMSTGFEAGSDRNGKLGAIDARCW